MSVLVVASGMAATLVLVVAWVHIVARWFARADRRAVARARIARVLDAEGERLLAAARQGALMPPHFAEALRAIASTGVRLNDPANIPGLTEEDIAWIRQHEQLTRRDA